ncbi:hypothetical protein [Kineosporia sp. A_224]|uniref:hypothetical protein n=1 Tax=Kineosporia sp. A_224 TaxID=1962180 RepID=UPI000B4B31DF|nr:hypothetical protein [Kineosporia sp. A_224]
MWWAAVHGRGADEAEAKAVDLLPFLASDDPVDEDEDDDRDDGDVFVEIKLRRFLEVLGVPVPDEVFDEA